MKQTYRSISDVLNSPWAALQPKPANDPIDRVLRSTKLEDCQRQYEIVRKRRRNFVGAVHIRGIVI